MITDVERRIDVTSEKARGGERPGAPTTEILFIVQDAPEGGLTARSADETIFTEAEDMDGLRAAVRDAVRCHFEEEEVPQLIRLHYVRDEVFVA